MSRGVFECFPSAKLIHYHNEEESNCHLSKALLSKSISEVIVVDSVVNEGKSVRNMIRHIQQLIANNSSTVPPRIYVFAAVIQKDASLMLPIEFPHVRFLALRVSDNKYKGHGIIDTGNRLFETH